MTTPWRSGLAGWSVAWRERWGNVANGLESNGLAWQRAEELAFDQVDAERRALGGADPPTSADRSDVASMARQGLLPISAA